MPLVVQKFGGTSVATPERILVVAERVAHARKDGNDVIVVVSAMGESTDELLDLAQRVSPNPPARELDMLLTAGERISMALLAIAIQDRGVEAVSFTGSQAGILTDAAHGAAKITEIRGHRVREALDNGRVVIVAGFQGVDPNTKEITTLGRGGSDATAVALAAAHDADVCEVFTDVDGVYSADPRIVSLRTAAARGVVRGDAGALRQRRQGPHGAVGGVRSPFRNSDPRPVLFPRREGTWVKEHTMEQAIISGIAHDVSEAKVTVRGVPDTPGVAAALFEPLAERSINVDMIVQNVSRDAATDISFTVPQEHAPVAREVASAVAAEVGAAGVDVDENVAKVSLVGAGMKSHPGVAARVFRALANKGINIQMISTSTIRISCVVDADQIDEAVRTLHDEFQPPLILEEVGA